jgi:hypothetical protein
VAEVQDIQNKNDVPVVWLNSRGCHRQILETWSLGSKSRPWVRGVKCKNKGAYLAQTDDEASRDHLRYLTDQQGAQKGYSGCGKA